MSNNPYLHFATVNDPLSSQSLDDFPFHRPANLPNQPNSISNATRNPPIPPTNQDALRIPQSTSPRRTPRDSSASSNNHIPTPPPPPQPPQSLISTAQLDSTNLHKIIEYYFPRYFQSAPNPTEIKSIVFELAVFFIQSPQFNFNFTNIKKTGAVWLDYSSLYDENNKREVLSVPGLATALKGDPTPTLKTIALSLHVTVSYITDDIDYSVNIRIDEQDWAYDTLILRILNYPYLTPPREFGATTNGQYLAFHATITRLSTIRPLITSISMVCPNCAYSITVHFEDGTFSPTKCTQCNRFQEMQPQFHQTTSVDWQEALVQEVIDPENNPIGHIPQLIEVELTRDLISKFGVGDLVQISGTLKARPGKKTDQYSVWVDVNAIHVTAQPDITTAFSAQPPPSIGQSDLDTEQQFIEQQYQHNFNTNINDMNNSQNDPTQSTILATLDDDFQISSTALHQVHTVQRQHQQHNHRLILDHQSKRYQFLSELAKVNEFFAKVIMPLYIPLDFPPIVAGGYTINQVEFQAIATIHKQALLPRFLIQSVCPQIYGHTSAKFGILLSLLGGVDRSAISPQEESIKKFNTILRENGIVLKSDDAFFQNYQAHFDGAKNGNKGEKDSNGQLNEDATAKPSSLSSSFQTTLVSNHQGGVASTSTLASPPAAQAMAANLRTRSNIHVLLVGEPGLGKSQLLREVSTLVARGVYIGGQGASGVGLTASLKKEGRGWTLQCGGVVIGDKGVTCIDELDKLGQETNALLECMEQQTVTITKAGTLCTLPSRTTIIAAANPKSGVYDKSKTVLENLHISPILLSRFDLIFLILDQADGQFDQLLSDHVMNQRAGVEIGGGNQMNQFGSNTQGAYPLSPGPQLTPIQLFQQQQQQHIQHHGAMVLNKNPFGQAQLDPTLDLLTMDFDPSTQSHTDNHILEQLPRPNQPPLFPDMPIFPSSNNNNNTNTILSYDELLLQCGYSPSQPLSKRYTLSMSELDQLDLIPPVLLKKYIAFAREYCRPTLSTQARHILQSFFLSLRAQVTSLAASQESATNQRPSSHYDPNQPTPLAQSTIITTRQLESLIRLTEARAKLELRPIALALDAYEAIEIVKETMFQQFLHLSSTSSGGALTMQPLTKSTKKVSLARLTSMFTTQLALLARDGGNGAVYSYAQLKDVARKISGFDMTKFTAMFDNLREQGDLIMDQGRSDVFRYTAL